MASIVSAISLVLLLSGCGNGEEEFTARPGAQQYGSAKEIADDLAAAGITCESFARDASTEYSADAGRCYVDGREVVLSTFASESRQEENIASLVGTFEAIRLATGVSSDTACRPEPAPPGYGLGGCRPELTPLDLELWTGSRSSVLDVGESVVRTGRSQAVRLALPCQFFARARRCSAV